MTPLRAYRTREKITLGTVAARIGVSESQLSRIEREGTAKLKIALALADMTKAPVADFLKAA